MVVFLQSSKSPKAILILDVGGPNCFVIELYMELLNHVNCFYDMFFQPGHKITIVVVKKLNKETLTKIMLPQVVAHSTLRHTTTS